VIVMFVGAKPAYDGLKKLTDQYVPTTRLSKSIYNDNQSVVNTRKGSILLGMQGRFSGDALPITNQDVQAQRVAISKVGSQARLTARPGTTSRPATVVDQGRVAGLPSLPHTIVTRPRWTSVRSDSPWPVSRFEN
jgi:hypothetical protein